MIFILHHLLYIQNETVHLKALLQLQKLKQHVYAEQRPNMSEVTDLCVFTCRQIVQLMLSVYVCLVDQATLEAAEHVLVNHDQALQGFYSFYFLFATIFKKENKLCLLLHFNLTSVGYSVYFTFLFKHWIC